MEDGRWRKAELRDSVKVHPLPSTSHLRFYATHRSRTVAAMLDPAASRIRQQRLLPGMREAKVDAFVVGLPAHVYYLSAHDNFWQHQSALAVFRDGSSLLVRADGAQGDVAADQVETYEATWNGQPVPIRAYFDFIPVVDLPPGATGIVELRYRPSFLRWGLPIAGLSLVMLLVAVATARNRARR